MKDWKDRTGTDGPPGPPAPLDADMSRREFLNWGVAAAGAAAATAAALSPLKHLEEFPSLGAFLQKHYKELTPAEMEKVLDRIRSEVKREHGVTPQLADPKPLPGVEYAYALSIGRCIGCRKCVYACVRENNQSREPQLQYIRVLKLKKGAIDIETAVHDYKDPKVPDPDHYYMPVQCHHCQNPPCVKACPVQATWREKDGIVVIDYDWCIGCRYCEVACPYWARKFNFSKPGINSADMNPDMAYLSNRPRGMGVMEKCHFCLQRARKGRYPACVEVCPTGSRKFGNILDPESEISKIIRTKRVYILKEEVGTLPRFFYYFDL